MDQQAEASMSSQPAAEAHRASGAPAPGAAPAAADAHSAPPSPSDALAAPLSNGPSPRLLSVLTDVQHGSAALFASFLVVHTAAPAVALVAAESGAAAELAGKTMILGRVYYQSALTEPLFVWGALAAHVGAGLAKRLLRTFARWQAQERRRAKGKARAVDDGDDAAGATGWPSILPAPLARLVSRVRSALPPLSWQSFTGLLLVPLTLQHAALNRLVPRLSRAPIHALSPSELDYTYVAYGLLERPKITAALYTGLVLVAGRHAAGGAAALYKRARRRQLGGSTDMIGGDSVDEAQATTTRKASSRRRWHGEAVAAGAISAVLCASLVRLRAGARDELRALPRSVLPRYDACYALTWPYSWAGRG